MASLLLLFHCKDAFATTSSRHAPACNLDPMPKRKKVKKFDQKNEVRAIARERVGIVPGSRVLDQKEQRKKPKYKKDPEVE